MDLLRKMSANADIFLRAPSMGARIFIQTITKRAGSGGMDSIIHI